jgi:seryl-tRNA synthetase
MDKQGNRKVLHTLNDTALATSRIMVTLLENNQQANGSITIPKVLWPYTGFKIIEAKEQEKLETKEQDKDEKPKKKIIKK